MNEANEVIEELKQAVDKVLEMSGAKFARANVEVSRMVGSDFKVEYLVSANTPGFRACAAASLEDAFAQMKISANELREQAADLIRQAENMEGK